MLASYIYVYSLIACVIVMLAALTTRDTRDDALHDALPGLACYFVGQLFAAILYWVGV